MFQDLEDEDFGQGRALNKTRRKNEAAKEDLDDEALAPLGGVAKSQGAVAKYEENCRSCRGTGEFISYSGRLVGECFKCKGKGKLYFRTSAEQRARNRKKLQERKIEKAAEVAARAAEFSQKHPAQIAYMSERVGRWDLMASFEAALHKHGSLTEKQLAVIDRAIARDEEKREARRAERASGEALDLSMVPGGHYAVPDSETRLKVRVRPVTKGKWAGWIFVDDGAEYGSRQNYGRQKPGDYYEGAIVDQLKQIAADPKAAMAAYGHLTGMCGRCGRLLENEESVALGIGPVCASKM